MRITNFLAKLPEPCRSLQIEPRHKTALDHFLLDDGSVWVVLLTTMPGKRCQAWRLTKREYWGLQPKHGTRDRFIRENFPPTVTGAENPTKPTQLTLF